MINEIVTGRLIMKPFKRADISDEYLSWLNDKKLMRFSQQQHKTHDYQSSLAYLETFVGTTNLFLGVFTKDKNILIGTLSSYIDEINQVADLGILIGHKDAAGKGFGFEAWSQMISELERKGIRKITGGAMFNNQAMIKIFLRSGMSLECTRRDHQMYNNKPVDVVYYSKFVFQ